MAYMYVMRIAYIWLHCLQPLFSLIAVCWQTLLAASNMVTVSMFWDKCTLRWSWKALKFFFFVLFCFFWTSLILGAKHESYCFAFKTIHRFWLAPKSQLTVHNQVAFTIFEKWKHYLYTILSTVYLNWKRGWSIAYLIGNEVVRAIDHRQATRLLIHEWTRTNGVHLIWTRELQEYTKHIARWISAIFWGVYMYLQGKTSAFETVPRIKPKVWSKSMSR